jgi:hypothetical protein
MNIGQGEKAPRTMWVLFDMDNGNPDSYRYIWYFASKRQAVAHRNRQNAVKKNARVVGPVRYTCDDAKVRCTNKVGLLARLNGSVPVPVLAKTLKRG